MLVPDSLPALAERVRRFLSRDSIRSAELHKTVIGPLSEIGNVYVFGGLIRDLAFFGNDERPISDVDLVVTGRPSKIDEFAGALGAKKNTFGGYGLKHNGLRVDFWPMSRTWAKTQNYIKLNKPSDLTKTTFFDWDAVVYNVATSDIWAIPFYLDRLRNRRLEINLAQTPSPKGNLVRALRRLVMWDARPGRQLRQYIVREAPSYSWNEILVAEKGAFHISYLQQFSSVEECIDLILNSDRSVSVGVDDRRQYNFEFLTRVPEQIAAPQSSFDSRRLLVRHASRSN